MQYLPVHKPLHKKWIPTMNLARKVSFTLAALAALGLATLHPPAVQAGLTVSGGAPTPGAFDISQLSNAGSDSGACGFNYYTDNFKNNTTGNPGQTFTTGSNAAGYKLSSISLQVGSAGNGNNPGAPFTLFLNALSNGGTTATQISSTSFSSPGLNDGDWATFTLPSAQLLSANTTYAYGMSDAYSYQYTTFANSNTNPYKGGQLAEIPIGGGAVSYGNSNNFDATFNIGLTEAVTRQSIGLKFGAEQTNGSLAPTDIAGTLPQANWNNLTGGTGSSASLIDSTGTTIKDASVSYIAPYTYSAAGDTSTPNRKLLDGYLDNNGVTDSVTVSGIKYSTYDVYAYIGSGGNDRTGTVTIGGTSYNYRTVGDPGGSFTQTTATINDYPNADYALFTGLTGGSFTMTQNLTGPNPYNSGIFGLQVVDASAPVSAAPEPSQLAGLAFTGFGALGLVLKARKRKTGTATV